MSLRPCDAEPLLRLKEQMIESDHDAIFSDGRKLPLFIYQKDSQTKYMVELEEYQFFEAKNLPGFLRLQKQPDTQPLVEPLLVESTKITGSTWEEQKTNAEMRGRKVLAERYEANKAQQTGLTAPDSAFAAASHKQAQVVAGSKGQSR